VKNIHYHEPMTTLTRGPNWKISIYGREHGIPHVHVTGPGFRAVLDIATGGILIGRLPADVLADARQWLAQHQNDAQRQWRIHNPD